MIKIAAWMDVFIRILRMKFGERVWFAGLQGSYARGEATENSDIDVVVILDKLSPWDIHIYDQMLNELSHRQQICGFLAGKSDVLNWDPADLFQLCFSTQPLIGSLDELVTLIDDTAVERAIKIGACNIFHGCVHNMLHEKSNDTLRGLLKTAIYVIQAIVYKQTGRFVWHVSDLQSVLDANNRDVVDLFLKIRSGGAFDFVSMSETLFLWAQKVVNGDE